MASSSFVHHSDSPSSMALATQPLSGRAYAVMLTLTTIVGLELGLLLLDISPILPLVRQQFDVGYVEAGWAISVTIICHTIAVALSGFIAGRTGPRPLLLTGLTLALISTIMRALAPNFPVLLASRAVTGLGTGCFVIGGVTAITLLSPPNRRVRDQGYFGAAQQLGIMLMLLMAPVGVSHFGIPIFWGLFTVELVLVLAAYVLLYPRAHAQAPSAAPTRTRPLTMVRDTYGWLLSLTNMAGYGAFVGVTGWMASFLVARYHTSPGQTALLTAGATFFAFIGRLAASPLLRVMPARWLMGGFTVVTAISLAATPFAANQQIAALLLLVFSLSSSVPFGMVFGSITSRPAPAGVSRRILLVTLNSNIVALLLPLLIGYTVSLTSSFSVGFWLIGACVGVVAIILLRSRMLQTADAAPNDPEVITA